MARFLALKNVCLSLRRDMSNFNRQYKKESCRTLLGFLRCLSGQRVQIDLYAGMMLVGTLVDIDVKRSTWWKLFVKTFGKWIRDRMKSSVVDRRRSTWEKDTNTREIYHHFDRTRSDENKRAGLSDWHRKTKESISIATRCGQLNWSFSDTDLTRNYLEIGDSDGSFASSPHRSRLL